MIDKNDNDSSSDDHDSSSNEKDKKPAAKMIPTVIMWRVRRIRRARTVSLLIQVTKKREMKEMRSRIEEHLQGHGSGKHCWCVA